MNSHVQPQEQVPDPQTPTQPEADAPAQEQPMYPVSETPTSQEQSPPSMEEREKELTARESALAQRERRLEATNHVLALGLDRAILDLFDYSSDEALANSLQLAALAAQAQPSVAPAPIPLASMPPMPAFATYVERARLFAEDPVAYAQMQEQQRSK